MFLTRVCQTGPFRNLGGDEQQRGHRGLKGDTFNFTLDFLELMIKSKKKIKGRAFLKVVLKTILDIIEKIQKI